VAVTGMGVVSPIGNDVASFRDALLAGVSGARRITLFDPARLPTRIAAEVRWDGPILRDRKVTFAVEAADQAMAGPRPRGEGGLSLGIGLELFSLDDLAARARPGFALPEGGGERLTFLQTPSDLCLHEVSRRHGLRHPPLAHVSACAAGADAIGAAFHMVASGRRDWMLAGGADSMINPLGVAGFCRIGATTTQNDDPTHASRPFDRRRDGFLLGEGAAVVRLEPLEAARARGATVHAEIVGYGNSFDAHGISEPHPEGRGAHQAMARALQDAGLTPDAIDSVSAHGTSTPKNDPVETRALKTLLGERARRVPVCATKSMIGHLISAAGAIQVVSAITCMAAGQVHPTVNLEEPDPLCDLDYVPGRARPHAQRYVLSNSFAFGGQNAALLLKAPDA
jgi:3-oxoacyl-[acyl-carrier-protein] synthase II